MEKRLKSNRCKGFRCRHVSEIEIFHNLMKRIKVLHTIFDWGLQGFEENGKKQRSRGEAEGKRLLRENH